MSDEASMGPYRVGRSLGRTLYHGDDVFGMVDDPWHATLVVRALNEMWHRDHGEPKSFEQEAHHWKDAHGYAEQRAEQAESKLRRSLRSVRFLHAALTQYGMHQGACPKVPIMVLFGATGECTCRLDGALGIEVPDVPA